jgi:PAS domain S-box-containing protein
MRMRFTGGLSAALVVKESLIRRLVSAPENFRRARGSVRAKLMAIVLITTAIAALIAGIAVLIDEIMVYRHSWATDLSTEARILSLSTAPALAFDDHASAARNLAALDARPGVLIAALYGANGRLYASYVRKGESPPPPQLPPAADGARISGTRVQLVQNVSQNGELLGTIYLEAHYDLMGRVKAYLGIFTFATGLSLSVALVLSRLLQRMITEPLDDIASVARQIVDRRDYSLRVRKKTGDEFGLVVEALNNMLHEVQRRARALEQSNAALRASEKLYRAIGGSIDYGVWISAPDGRNIYASESFLRLTGLTQERCSNYGWVEVLHPADLQQTLSSWEKAVRDGEPWYCEHRILGTDGAYHPILAQSVPMRGEHGEITGWAGINLDIGRLKATEEALREADRRKDEFLATLAHELRNPLAPIRHAVQILGAAGADARQREWGREVIARQAHRMALLLDDLLDVSRITRGRLELRKARVELQSLVDQAIETARPLLDVKGHRLRVALPALPITLEVDPLRLSQALSNLLTNAAKYTDAGGQISLTVTVAPDELAMSVTDTGIGLESGVIPKLFEMFSQVDSAVDRAEGGLGIGLALVRGLVGLHGGTVEANSPGLGQGSEFTIRLPQGAFLAPPDQSDALRPSGETPRRERCKVLVVDDNRDAADSLALILEMSGHTVSVAHSGQEALEVGSREQPAAVILDIGMPDMSGYDVAGQIRGKPWGRNAFLLAVTGWGQDNDKQLARSAGFDQHLTKPVDADQVEELLARFIRKAG